jgi:hypothetical protein
MVGNPPKLGDFHPGYFVDFPHISRCVFQPATILTLNMTVFSSGRERYPVRCTAWVQQCHPLQVQAQPPEVQEQGRRQGQVFLS